jgi:hypothetical protein
MFLSFYHHLRTFIASLFNLVFALPILDRVFGLARPAAFVAILNAPLGKVPGLLPVCTFVPAFKNFMASFTALFALLTLRLTGAT